MFLPDNLLRAFDSASVDNRSLVKEKRPILTMPALENKSLLITPSVAFGLLLVIVAALTVTKKRWAQKVVGTLDFLLFFSLGVVGLLLLFMWFGTDHALCANNYNLAWAVPTHLVAAFFVHKTRTWVQRYFEVVFWATVLLLAMWAFLPQHMNPAFLPLVISVAIRARVISKRNENAGKRI
jgi:hypothetical protein